MKNVRKFVPALVMLIVSALMLSTASFAWFAMSDTVAAENMEVTIRSESVYLVIAGTTDTFTAPTGDDDAAKAESIRNQAVNNQASKTSAPGYTTDRTDLLPAAIYGNDGVNRDGDNFIVQSATDLRAVDSWYTASASDSTASTMAPGSASSLTTFDGYVVRYKYYVTLTAGSDAVNNMQVQNVTVTAGTVNTGDDISPVKVVVACNGVWDEYSNSETNSSTDFLPDATKLTSDSYAEIEVYVYYDGNENNVYTENFASLSDATISFELKVSSNG